MENLQSNIEALIFASDTPLPQKKIKEILELESEKDIRKTVAQINKNYEKIHSPLQIIEVAGGYQVVTREEYASLIKQLYRSRAASHLTQRALETMAIIAYKQPITKTEVEAIRGVSADGVIRTLIERNLITVTGRLKAPGNPLLYGTTKYFLEYFGLKHIKDLPQLKEIDELLKSDDKFLESLDQVALQQMYPEELGLTSMQQVTDEEESPELQEAKAEEANQTQESEAPEAKQEEQLKEEVQEDKKNDATE